MAQQILRRRQKPVKTYITVMDAKTRKSLHTTVEGSRDEVFMKIESTFNPSIKVSSAAA